MRKKVLSLAVFGIFLVLVACNAVPTSSGDEYNPEVYLVMVNKTHQIPDNWEIMIKLDTVKNSLGEDLEVEHKTYRAFLKLREEFLRQDIQIELDSAYRSVLEQQEIWDDWLTDPELGEEYCEKYLAKPGFSEHHTGLAVDIFITKNGEEIRENEDMLADEEDFKKIHAVLPKYGFILRYPEGKEEITGYAYEPWHLRYIDSVEIAEKITEGEMTLEEYLGEEQ